MCVCVGVSQMVLAAEMLVPVLIEWIPGNALGISTTMACQLVILFQSSEMEDTIQDFLTFS